jgi:hypothetical protein
MKQNVIVAFVTEAFISTLQDVEPLLSPSARARKAAQLAADLTPAETLDIFNETQR